MPELHETIMGRRLIEHTLPEIATQLKRVADCLEKKEEPLILPEDVGTVSDLIELLKRYSLNWPVTFASEGVTLTEVLPDSITVKIQCP